jgi:cation transport ATPase
LWQSGVKVAMVGGDNRTAARIGRELGIKEVIAEVLPGAKAGNVTELQGPGRRSPCPATVAAVNALLLRRLCLPAAPQ